MAIRTLHKADLSDPASRNEFNHLRMTDPEKFFAEYIRNDDHYATPYSILADLEAQIKFENDPDEVILCRYKPDGDCIFKLTEIREEGMLRIVFYEYIGMAC